MYELLSCGRRRLTGRRSARALIALVLLAATTAVPVAAQRSAGTPIDRVIAVVNQEAITARELESRVAMVENQMRERRSVPPPREVLEKQVLEQMILLRAQLQYADDVGVKPSEAEIDRAVGEVAQRNRLTVQQLRERMAEQGVGFAAFREQLSGEIASARLREREAASKVTISEAEVDAQLARSGAAGASEYEIGHILLRLPSEPDAGAVRSRRELADQILARARAGEDFAALAREYSESPEGMQGGSLGWRNPDRLPALFVEAVARLEPGQIAPVVRSPAGLHVLRLIDKRSQAPQAATVERIRARHILLEAATPAAEDDARRRLAEFKRNIESGSADFAAVARQFSTDGSASSGGDLGWLYPGETVPEFERAMAALAVGAISEPMRTQFGIHLIQVLERRADADSPDRLRALARQALREQKADEAFDQWLRELRDRAYVEFRLEQI